MSNSTRETLETTAKVLLRCTGFGFLFLLIWVGFFLLAGDLVHDLHGGMFDLTKHELNVIHYCGMAMMKTAVFLFFLFPWLSIKLVLWKPLDQADSS